MKAESTKLLLSDQKMVRSPGFGNVVRPRAICHRQRRPFGLIDIDHQPNVQNEDAANDFAGHASSFTLGPFAPNNIKYSGRCFGM